MKDLKRKRENRVLLNKDGGGGEEAPTLELTSTSTQRVSLYLS